MGIQSQWHRSGRRTPSQLRESFLKVTLAKQLNKNTKQALCNNVWSASDLNHKNPNVFLITFFFRVCLIVVQTKCGNTSSCRADFFRTKKKRQEKQAKSLFYLIFYSVAYTYSWTGLSGNCCRLRVPTINLN